MSSLKRALDLLEHILEAVPQSGPDASDRDVEDFAELCMALHDAEAFLYEHGRLVP